MLFHILGLDVRDLYKLNKSGDLVESQVETDYTLSQIVSISFAQAERRATDRLHRLDEFKAVLDQILDSKAYERYKELRQEIVDSYSVEETNPNVTKPSLEEIKKHNKEASKAMSMFMGK